MTGQCNLSYIQSLQLDYRQAKKRLWGPAVPVEENKLEDRHEELEDKHETAPSKPDPHTDPRFLRALRITLKLNSGKPFPPGPHSTIKLHNILRIGCAYFGCTREELTGPSRKYPITRHRHILMYLMRDLTGKSYPDIARILGKKDHTTIIHGINATKERIETKQDYRDDVDALRKLILLHYYGDYTDVGN